MSTKIPPHLLTETEQSEPQLHIPVLLQSVVEQLAPRHGESYLDLTAGYGGHARAVIALTKAPEKANLVDRDQMAIDALSTLRDSGVELIHDDYAHYAEQAAEQGRTFDMILVDLGVSSPQLDKADRGFSLKRDGPLDMRMDRRQHKTADDLVNHGSKDYLAEIIEHYGEEPRSRAIKFATAIINARPVHTTNELAEIIRQSSPGAYKKTHPATRTFQAIRIALNDELGQLERLLNVIPKLLNRGGRVAIISFHSLEDGRVKRFFKEQAESGYEAELDLLRKKPTRGKLHDVTNPRARSATLRTAVKK